MLNLDSLLEKKQPIYVRNNALRSHLLIVVQLKDKHGKSQELKLPPTALPVELTARFSADMIRESTDLRGLIAKQVVVLVDPKEAQTYLASAEGQEEQSALQASIYADTAPATAARDSLARLKQQTSVDASDVLNTMKAGEAENGASHRVKGIVASLLSKDKSVKETLLNLKRVKGTLVEADYQYLLTSCRSEKAILEFAETAMAEFQATPEQPFGQ
jgi:hypothetical protein